MPKPTTGKVSVKRYRCTRCGHEFTTSTNHWGEIYAPCDNCNWKHPIDGNPVSECLEPMPEGFEKPTPWKKVRLGDIMEVIDV